MNPNTQEFEQVVDATTDEYTRLGMPVFTIGQKFHIGEVEFQIDGVRRRSLVITPTDKTWKGLLNRPETLSGENK